MPSSGTTRRELLTRSAAGTVGLVVGAGLMPSAAPRIAHAQAASSSEVAFWNGVALQIFRDGRPAPTVAARGLAILNTCIYDAWTAYHPTARPTIAASVDLKRPASEATLENKQRAI